MLIRHFMKAKGRDPDNVSRSNTTEHDMRVLDNSGLLQDDINFTFQLDPDMMGSLFNGWEGLDFMPVDQ